MFQNGYGDDRSRIGVSTAPPPDPRRCGGRARGKGCLPKARGMALRRRTPLVSAWYGTWLRLPAPISSTLPPPAPRATRRCIHASRFATTWKALASRHGLTGSARHSFRVRARQFRTATVDTLPSTRPAGTPIVPFYAIAAARRPHATNRQYRSKTAAKSMPKPSKKGAPRCCKGTCENRSLTDWRRSAPPSSIFVDTRVLLGADDIRPDFNPLGRGGLLPGRSELPLGGVTRRAHARSGRPTHGAATRSWPTPRWAPGTHSTGRFFLTGVHAPRAGHRALAACPARVVSAPTSWRSGSCDIARPRSWPASATGSRASSSGTARTPPCCSARRGRRGSCSCSTGHWNRTFSATRFSAGLPRA